MNTKINFQKAGPPIPSRAYELKVILENKFIEKFSMEDGFVVAGEKLFSNWGHTDPVHGFRYTRFLLSSEEAESRYKQAIIQEVQDAVDFLAQKSEDKEKNVDERSDEVVVFSSQQRDKEEV